MPVDGVPDEVGPVVLLAVVGGVGAHRGGLLIDRSDDPLGNPVEVVVVRRARLVVQVLLGAQIGVRFRLELPFVVSHDGVHAMALRRLLSIFVDGHADQAVELGDHELGCLEELGAVSEERDENVA